MKFLIPVIIFLISALNVNATSYPIKKDEGYEAFYDIESYDGKAFTGLRFDLDDGYKTYWKHPGDGGLPPVINLENAVNVKSYELIFPAPERFLPFEDIQTIGYKSDMAYPLIITAEDDTKPVSFTLKGEFGVCKDLCLFGEIDQAISIEPNYNSGKTAISNEIANADSDKITVNSYGLKDGKLMFDISADDKIKQADVFINANDEYRFGKTDVTIDGKNAVVSLNISDAFGENEVKATDIKEEFEYQVSVKTDDGFSGKIGKVDFANLAKLQEAKKSDGNSILYLIFAAFIGGLILNIMPCVLPILGVKIIGVVKSAGVEKKQIRKKFIASALGIILSFLLLAGIVIYIKSLGNYFGWGTHFQHNEFLYFLFFIMLFFGLNQLGLFEIKLPSLFNNKLASAGGNSDSLLSHFMTGVLATILATPCSAPFVGTAVSFALSQGSLQVFYIFLFMSLGLAFPYLLLIAFPSAVSVLPKPGAWMNKVKQFMGILLLASAVWIGSIIYNNYTGGEAVKGEAVKFNEQQLTSLVNEGKTVFVDITADWCLNCKYNKKFVINTDEVQNAFKANNIVFMQGDYTRPSPEITEFLKSHDRYAIPFDAVFKQGKVPVILSEKLTISEVLESLGQ